MWWVHVVEPELKYTQSALFVHLKSITVKPVLSGHSKRRQKNVFKTDCPLMQVESIAECSKHSAILSTFIKLPFVIKILFCLFLSGRLRQVLH